jgi:hypothetical protein
MRDVDRAPIEDEEESEFPGCLIAGILITILGSLYILITALTRIKDLIICNKPVDFLKAAIQKQRSKKRNHREENIEK